MAQEIRGCYMVQRQGVCGSRFDSDDVQTCGIIVLLLCGQFTAEHYFSIEVSFKGSGFTCCIEWACVAPSGADEVHSLE
ncbi:unnamed protein product [Sphagnum balticum]